jgi:hypothetical protein
VGHNPLITGYEALKWTCDPEIGTVDGYGLFTAGNRAASGYVYVTAGGVTSGVYVTVNAANVFIDISGHWAEYDILDMYDGGIITGYTNERGARSFMPNNKITRAEMAVILCRYLQIDTASYENVSLPYADIAALPDWALPSVKALYSEKIMTGQANNGKTVFEPTANITRAEAFTAIGRIILDGSETNSELSFTDEKEIPSWALMFCKKLTAIGVIGGYEDGTIKPADNISRAETAKLINKIRS